MTNVTIFAKMSHFLFRHDLLTFFVFVRNERPYKVSVHLLKEAGPKYASAVRKMEDFVETHVC